MFFDVHGFSFLVTVDADERTTVEVCGLIETFPCDRDALAWIYAFGSSLA